MNEKKRVCVIYGGMSTEHDVSIISGKNVIDNLDKEKFNVSSIVIDKNGNWLEEGKKTIKNIKEHLKKNDIVFPVLHGKYGEDGTIQGMLDLLKIPYVGCGVLASSISMDKVYTKRIFEKANIQQAKYIFIKNGNIYVDANLDEIELNNSEIAELVEKELGYPVFVKPSNSGSSVGISKATNNQNLIKAIEQAKNYDNKILIEKGIQGKEVECAVLGNDKEVRASTVGEIIPAEDFYSYDAKYNNSKSIVKIPADISENKMNEIKRTAIKAFKAVDGKGLSRVDFFIEDKTNNVIINEINTMPGFTEISMYPKLWKYEGLSYSELLTKLIELTYNKAIWNEN
ncbi:MAG: D-alanine--D-alanine ligase [Clostridia bacterium]|nr:D-alanine--D-alanine ligase [Clostridia bacterium]